MIYGVQMTEDGMRVTAYKDLKAVLDEFRENESEPHFVRVEDIDEQSDPDDIALIEGKEVMPKPKKVVQEWAL